MENTIKQILSNPNNYKVCMKCHSINEKRLTKCWNCKSSWFHHSAIILRKKAKTIMVPVMETFLDKYASEKTVQINAK